jgi:hypothetical protein
MLHRYPLDTRTRILAELIARGYTHVPIPDRPRRAAAREARVVLEGGLAPIFIDAGPWWARLLRRLRRWGI